MRTFYGPVRMTKRNFAVARKQAPSFFVPMVPFVSFVLCESRHDCARKTLQEDAPMLFVIIAKDKPDSLPLRMATRAAHLEYVKATGAVRLAGPFIDAKGEMIG